MGNFFCLVHDRRKGHIIVVANVVKQPFQLHHQAGCVHLAAGRLLQLSGHTLYLGLRSMVPSLRLLTVKHLAQGNVHLVQPLCKEVLDLFHNGLLFFELFRRLFRFRHFRVAAAGLRDARMHRARYFQPQCFYKSTMTILLCRQSHSPPPFHHDTPPPGGRCAPGSCG